ncbi:MAG: hypothetical protein N3G20_05595, partial [Verrucomicrobiae bacterium]|nr:hypothetical protein [Verrucomicrobiae bacterium]
MRILIATLTVGGGHLAAAAALEEAWRKIRPADTVERVDLMQFFSPLHRKLYTDGWVHITTHAPELWGLVFDRTDDPDVARRLRRTRRLFPSSSRRRFRNFVAEFQPDVVLCTHYLPVEVLGAAENEEPNTRSFAGDSRSTTRRAHDEPDTTRPWTSSFVVSVVTDFEVHAVWMAPAVGLYCVAAEESRTRLVARGGHPCLLYTSDA